jgi:hypothetical protein
MSSYGIHFLLCGQGIHVSRLRHIHYDSLQLQKMPRLRYKNRMMHSDLVSSDRGHATLPHRRASVGRDSG